VTNRLVPYFDETLKHRIQRIIAGEDRSRPLDDTEIAARLSSEGVAVARRAVTKHRKQLGIASSRVRIQRLLPYLRPR
jgi:RNA polymerase sigma-54 factor